MNNRRSCPHHHHHQYHQQQHAQQSFKDKCRVFEHEHRRINDTIDKPKNDVVNFDPLKASTRSTYIPTEQSPLRNTAQRSSSINSKCNSLLKDRETAKLKALIFEKDNELIALTMANKNALKQMEERLEREKIVWNEHKELLLAGERTKFEEEKARLLKNSQDQLKLEQERCQRLEQKLYDAQMLSSEAQLMLKESGRERINAVYGTKEQCRREFQDEVARLRNQFQTEKDAELTRIQKRVQELEDELDRVSTENLNANLRQRELLVGLETAEKSCIRSISDCIKKLLMAMDSPPHAYTKIPQITSFSYDRESIYERLPTRNITILLEDTVNDIKNYINEQKLQIEAQPIFTNKPSVLTDRTADSSNRTYENDKNHCRNPNQQSAKHFLSKSHKENDYYFRDTDHFCHPYDNEYHHSLNNRCNHFPLSEEQNHTIDNLVQKLEDHIASELNRLTKQRLTIHVSNPYDHKRTTSFPLETPKQVKFESDPENINNEATQGSWIHHLHDRFSGSSNDKIRLFDNQSSKSNFSAKNKSTFQDDNHHSSFSPTHLNNFQRRTKVDI